MTPVRILLVDDHAILRAGVRALLAPHADLQVVGEASDGATAISAVNELHPDVVVMDIAMPGINGLTATREIVQAHPAVRVLILSQYENREYVLPLLKVGAAGYVLKRAADTDLIEAIRVVARGESFLYPPIAKMVVEAYLQDEPSDDGYSQLTECEREVLILVAQGQTARQIAELLHISSNTVDVHRAHLMHKLGLHSVAEVSVFAVRHGLLGDA